MDKKTFQLGVHKAVAFQEKLANAVGASCAIRKSSASPRASDTHPVDRILTDFAMNWVSTETDRYIAMQAVPNLPVSQRSNTYIVFDRESFLRDDMRKRAEGDEASATQFTYSDDTYLCERWALAADVSDEAVDNADSPIQPLSDANEALMNKALMRRDALMADTLFTAANWGTNTDAGKNWTGDTADPIKDIDDAKAEILDATGFLPNRLSIGYDTYLAFRNNNEIIDRIKYGQTPGGPAIPMLTAMAAMFDLEQITVSRAVRNTAQRGAAENTSKIVGDVALLYYAPASVGVNTVTAFSQFSWRRPGYSNAGMASKRIRNEMREATRVEVNMHVDFKINAQELGYLFTAVTS